jgi:hypothetical protein
LITGFLLEDSDAVLGHFKVSAIICWIFLRQYDFNQLSF